MSLGSLNYKTVVLKKKKALGMCAFRERVMIPVRWRRYHSVLGSHVMNFLLDAFLFSHNSVQQSKVTLMIIF